METPGAYRVEEVAKLLQIGRNKAYELANNGTFPVMKFGKLIRIPKAAFDEWLNESESPKQGRKPRLIQGGRSK